MTIFQAGNTTHTPRQFRRSRPWARSNFQDMLSQIRFLQQPWQPPAFRDVPPQSRSTEPVFKTIHALSRGAPVAAASQHRLVGENRRAVVGIIQLSFAMPPVSNQVSNQSPLQVGQTSAESPSETRPSTAHAFWQILTLFDSTKLSTHRAFRNALGVVLPLIAGFALHMPRGGLVVASGALNVSYSDGSDPYSMRVKRMLASSVICAVAVFVGAISGKHVVLAVTLAAVWAFVAGMFVAVAGAAPDLGIISLVTLFIYAAQHLSPREAAISGILALAGGLLQTALSVALWPVRRYDPERRVLESFYRELANRASGPWNATSSPLASAHSEQAQDALLGLARDEDTESIRY